LLGLGQAFFYLNYMVQDYPNFLSLEEIKIIKNSIYELKEYWKHISQYENSHAQIYKGTPAEEAIMEQCKAEYTLGDAIYKLEGKKENIDIGVQLLLVEKFYWLYKKLINKIELITSIPTELEDELTVPGFHVFTGSSQPLKTYDYHLDLNILDFYPKLDVDQIYSFVSLIESNGTTPYLDYKTGTKNYEFGTLHIWKGNIPHRIGQLELKQNDSRITFQGHYYYDPVTNSNKLFF
jgi:hypothetical protein